VRKDGIFATLNNLFIDSLLAEYNKGMHPEAGTVRYPVLTELTPRWRPVLFAKKELIKLTKPSSNLSILFNKYGQTLDGFCKALFHC
jgi:hypothetical protein